MQTNRTTIVIVLLVYLISLAFLFQYMGQDIQIDYSTTTQSIGVPISFLGMSFTVGDNFLGNIVVGVASMPIWFNTLFIVIPSVLLAVFTIMMFIPTIPSG